MAYGYGCSVVHDVKNIDKKLERKNRRKNTHTAHRSTSSRECINRVVCRGRVKKKKKKKSLRRFIKENLIL